MGDKFEELLSTNEGRIWILSMMSKKVWSQMSSRTNTPANMMEVMEILQDEMKTAMSLAHYDIAKSMSKV